MKHRLIDSDSINRNRQIQLRNKIQTDSINRNKHEIDRFN